MCLRSTNMLINIYFLFTAAVSTGFNNLLGVSPLRGPILLPWQQPCSPAEHRPPKRDGGPRGGGDNVQSVCGRSCVCFRSFCVGWRRVCLGVGVCMGVCVCV